MATKERNTGDKDPVKLRLKNQCTRTDSSIMLGQFESNWLPTLAWALTGFTGLAFCQQLEVKGREGRDGHYTELQGIQIQVHTECTAKCAVTCIKEIQSLSCT